VTGVCGGTRLGLRLAAALLMVAAISCGQTMVNPVAPGRLPPEVNVPDAVDALMDGFSVHLEPTVMLWAQEAKVDLPAVVRRALEHIEGRLDGPQSTIHVSAGNYFTIPDVGIGGLTDQSTGTVRISMDMESPVPLRTLLTVWLPITMAHELHHSARILDGPGYGQTLLDSLVSEGGAEAFVRETYPDAPSIPWVRPLDPRTEARTWREARTVLRSLDGPSVHNRWFYGRDGVPRWAGYKLGYQIATAYLDLHPKESAADLARRSSAEIYRGSRYDP
jgi:hypothetical protein